MKPCLKILQMLKANKTSWPFRDPVDPIAQGVPNYLDIIKEPMDLTTIETNLKNNFYGSSTQFHADISKIIKNSYHFNKNNPEFLKLTSEFEQYYAKINADPSVRIEPTNLGRTTFPPKPKKTKPAQKVEQKYREPNESQPVTLAEKKALALELKRFPKEYLKGVADIVYEGQPPQSEELNIENLSTQKIRQLQRYVQSKLVLMEQKNQPYRSTVNENDQGSEESSFASDSDS